MKKLKLVLLIFNLTYFCFSPIYADPDPEVEALKNEVNILKKEANDMEATIEKQKQAYEKQEEKLEAIQEEFKKIHDDHSWYFNLFSIIGIILSSVAGYSLYQLFFGIRKWIKNEIGNTITRNKEALLRLVDLQELEEKYKAKIPVMVVSPNAELREDFNKEFGNMGFKEMKHHTGETPIKLEAGLVVLNQVGKEQVNEFIGLANENTYFVAYTKDHLDRHDRLNMANSPMTLYARILETLKFSSLVK